MNLKLRLQNKAFWTSIIALIMLCTQFICKNWGIEFDTVTLNNNLTAILTAAVTIGLVVDPTTPGLKDSSVSLQKKNIYTTATEVIENNTQETTQNTKERK